MGVIFIFFTANITLVATLGIPCMSQTSYTRGEKQLASDVSEAASKCMKDAAEEEKRLVISKGSVDEKG